MSPEAVKIVMLAVISEALTEYIFSGIGVFERHIKKISVLSGVVVALVFGADMFPLMGLTAVSPIMGQILTGILISRGSNLFNTLMEAANSRLKKNA